MEEKDVKNENNNKDELLKGENVKKEDNNKEETVKKEKKSSYFKKKEVWFSGIVGLVIGAGLVFLLIFLGLPEFGYETVVKFKGGRITQQTLFKELEKDRSIMVDLALDKTNQAILDREYKLTDKDHEKINKQVEHILDSYRVSDLSEEDMINNIGFNSKEEFVKQLEFSYKLNLYFVDYCKTLIPEDKIKSFYDEKVKIGEINTKHMLVQLPKDEDALKLANEIIAKLNNGEDFDSVADEYKDKVLFQKDIDIDSFNSDTMAEEYVNASKELEKGSFTKSPVKTSFGYHIIYVVDKKDVPSFEEAEGDIVKKLAEELSRKRSIYMVKSYT